MPFLSTPRKKRIVIKIFIGHQIPHRKCDTGLVGSSYHYGDAIMGAMASQITSLIIVYSTVYSGADQRKHQSSASLAFMLGIHRWPVNSPHKWPVTRKMFPFGDVIMHIVLLYMSHQIQHLTLQVKVLYGTRPWSSRCLQTDVSVQDCSYSRQNAIPGSSPGMDTTHTKILATNTDITFLGSYPSCLIYKIPPCNQKV